MNKIELCGIDKCTQCLACQNVCPKGCISMQEAKDGFSLPVIDRDKCVGCGACMKACHRLTPVVNYYTPLKAYACWTKNQIDRKRSSSGGAFSILARKILGEGGIVYGASMSEDLQVRHIGVESVDDIILLQGSKYVQSYMGYIYKDVKTHLCNGRKVLFSGTPCQIGGLLTYLHRDYDNLYTCDVVCHGVPSQRAFDVYIDKIGLRNKCKNFNFRFTEGWGFQLSRQLESPTRAGSCNKKLINPKKAYYLRAFTKGLMFSEACYTCIYACPDRVTDVTLADYWGIGVMKPFKYPTHKGISLLLINSDKALSLLNECSDLLFEERPFEEAIRGNHNLSHPSERPAGRDAYYEDAKIMLISALSKKYKIKATIRDYMRLLKQIINTYRK